MKRSLVFSPSWYTITDMNISSFKAFALKPRKLANTFLLWGVLYPCLFFVMYFINHSSILGLVLPLFDSNYYDISTVQLLIFNFFITLVAIEVFFALFLTFRASKSIGTCILQLFVSIPILFLLFWILITFFAGYD